MNNSAFEQKKFFQKFREYFSLFMYIIFILIFSIIIMDLIVYPATVFAVKNQHAFSKLFIIAAAVIFLLYIVFKVTVSLLKSRKDRLTFDEIMTNFLMNRLSSVSSFLIIILFFVLIILAAKFLLEQNYYLIYKTLK